MAPLTLLDRPYTQTHGSGGAVEELSTHGPSTQRERVTAPPARQGRAERSEERQETTAPSTRPGTSPGLMDALRDSVERSRKGSSALDDALVSLRDLAMGNGGGPDALETARLLQRAALERKHSAPRAASVALVVSDALTFTNVATLAAAAREPLQTALRVLVRPFISTEDERDVLQSFLANRWYVTPAFDSAAMLAEEEVQTPERA